MDDPEPSKKELVASESNIVKKNYNTVGECDYSIFGLSDQLVLEPEFFFRI